jgi:phenylpyruvate tautomerase PptA (4-oxalocrotonate tautomerase family)
VPILDIEIVQADGAPASAAGLTQALADAAGRSLGATPGRTWVRLRRLPASHYAESESVVADDELPVFVTLLHARPPHGEALADEVRALTLALATCLGRAPERVHLQYAPPGAGRQAFGGELVR